MARLEDLPTPPLGLPIIETGETVVFESPVDLAQSLTGEQPLLAPDHEAAETSGSSDRALRRIRRLDELAARDPLVVETDRILAAAQSATQSVIHGSDDLPLFTQVKDLATRLPRRAERHLATEAQLATDEPETEEVPQSAPHALVFPQANALELEMAEGAADHSYGEAARRWNEGQYRAIHAERMQRIAEQLSGITDFVVLADARMATSEPEVRRLIGQREYDLFNEQQPGPLAHLIQPEADDNLSAIETLQTMLAEATDEDDRIAIAYEITKLKEQEQAEGGQTVAFGSATTARQTEALGALLEGLRRL